MQSDTERRTVHDVDLGLLQTRGFVVIPGFLTPAELERLRADYERQPLNTGNANYKLTALSDEAAGEMRRRVVDVLSAVGAATDLKVDFPTSGSYFATGPKRGIFFHWHQDHESFFEVQNHYDYLNFYIPIVKPRVEKSNLSIVPFDVLQRDRPRTFNYTVRGGATRFGQVGRRQVAVHDDGCSVHFIRGGLDRIAHTPQLAAGDLLLMRGDVIHRTQDAETERVAVSFRAAAGSTIVRRSRLVKGGYMKAVMMANNRLSYQRLFAAFDASGRQEMTYRELSSALETIDAGEQAGWRQFWTFLLREKLRAGAIPQLILSFASLKAINVAATCSGRYYLLRRRLQQALARRATGAVSR